MDHSLLEQAEAKFLEGDLRRGQEAVFAFVRQANGKSPDEKHAACEALISRLDHPNPTGGAMFALGAGALIENGADPRPLAHALVQPIVALLRAAAPFVEATRAAPCAPEDDEDAYRVGTRLLTAETIESIGQTMPDAADAFFSIDTWYRPIAAAWSRDLETLARVQSNDAFLGALAKVGDSSDGLHWLSILVQTCVHTEFVVWLPEIDKAYEMRLAGVADVGQWMVLLSHALAPSLGK